MEDDTRLNKITVRFNKRELLALQSCADEMGFVDRNGKPKISTFIRHAIKSSTVYKNKLLFISKQLKEKEDE